MEDHHIIVIGASAGGFEPLKQIVRDMPARLNAAIFIVWHISPDVRGILPEVLNGFHTLNAANAKNMEEIKPGRIYVAPPDHHLIIETGYVRITKGPRENRFRPAIDPLFRSAAFAYGPRVIALILSGALDDGSSGLYAVKQKGGTTIVQDPADAEVPSMPRSAIKVAAPDHIVPVAHIAALLQNLVSEKKEVRMNTNKHDDKEKLKAEIDIAKGNPAPDFHPFKLGNLSPYTCPECHGVLASITEGGSFRFRCHTGHAFSADSLLASITESVEDQMWNAVRTIQESVMLLNHIGDHYAEKNQPRLAAMYFRKAKDAEARAEIVRKAVKEHEMLSNIDIVADASVEDETDEKQPQPPTQLSASIKKK
jgi:two-component system, chemotaxis family, protein-glutamate methylesterase/glutaminase